VYQLHNYSMWHYNCLCTRIGLWAPHGLLNGLWKGDEDLAYAPLEYGPPLPLAYYNCLSTLKGDESYKRFLIILQSYKYVRLKITPRHHLLVTTSSISTRYLLSNNYFQHLLLTAVFQTILNVSTRSVKRPISPALAITRSISLRHTRLIQRSI